MNIDMITTFLDDFVTFWKNIGKFLQPILELVKPEEGDEPTGSSLSSSGGETEANGGGTEPGDSETNAG